MKILESNLKLLVRDKVKRGTIFANKKILLTIWFAMFSFISINVSAQTVPATPSISKSIDNGVVTIRWSVPTGTFTRYFLTEMINEREYSFSVGVNSFVSNGTGRFIYAVRACNGPNLSNCSSPSPALDFTIVATPSSAAASSIPAPSSVAVSSTPASSTPSSVSASSVTPPPAVPTINAVGVDVFSSVRSFTVTWSNVGASRYEVEYSGSTANNITASSVWTPRYSGSSFQWSELMNASLLYNQWRVRSCNSTCSAWVYSRTKTYQPQSVATANSLVSPADGDIVYFSGANPCFQWQGDANASGYTVTVSNGSDFPEKRWGKSVAAGVTNTCWDGGAGWSQAGVYAAEVPTLSIGTTFYWRVVAGMPAGNGFTATRSFTLTNDASSASQPIPPVPTITAVAADVFSTSRDFTVTWTDTKASTYEVEYSGSTTNNITATSVWSPRSKSAIFKWVEPMNAALNYNQWRVRACNNQCSAWAYSRTKTFQPQSVATTTSLLSPNDGAQIIFINGAPCFSWQVDPAATQINVAISNSPDFPEKRWSNILPAGTTSVCWNGGTAGGWEQKGTYPTEAPTLEIGKTFYWRVASVLSNGAVGYTVTRSFSLKAPSSTGNPDIRKVWNNVTTALKNNDRITLSQNFDPRVISQYNQVFDALNGELSQVVNQLGDIEPLYVSENQATYLLPKKGDDGGDYIYTVIFIKDKNGSWKVHQL